MVLTNTEYPKRNLLELGFHNRFIVLYVERNFYILFIRSKLDIHLTDENSKKESFDGSRKDINAAIDRICEFTGETYFLTSQWLK